MGASEHSVEASEHSVGVSEHSVVASEYSVEASEHSVEVSEHSVEASEHSVDFLVILMCLVFSADDAGVVFAVVLELSAGIFPVETLS